MIVRRLALFVALVFSFAMTQLPEFVEQYRQRLGGAIDELSAVIARFDADSAQQGLTEAGGIDRLKSNPERFVQQRGEQMAANVERLGLLRDAQARFGSDGPVTRLFTFATHYDGRIARGAFRDFGPAVPVSAEAFVLGLIGFLVGGSVAHLMGRPFRGRRARAAARAGAGARTGEPVA